MDVLCLICKNSSNFRILHQMIELIEFITHHAFHIFNLQYKKECATKNKAYCFSHHNYCETNSIKS